jgi:glucosamine 6-phosphate synthetase-like amidotransferase/phosphosugar isomerase protein
MCGIAGILLYPKNRSEQELEYIKSLASELAVENQARGTHATGIATFGEDGHDVLKSPIRADEITTYDTWLNFLDKNVNNKTQNILIHTRFATQGSPENNDNNHPIVTATNIGVHNGMIYNDGSLFSKEGLYRQAKVDSEIIFRLADKELANDTENIKNVAEKLSGVFAVAYVRKDETNVLNYFRNNNPTTFAYIPELNITVFASLEKFIEDAINTTNAISVHTTGFMIIPSSVKFYSPQSNVAMQFDVSENTPIQQLEQTPIKFTENYTGYYGSYYAYNDDWYDEWYDDRYGEAYSEESKTDINNIYDFLEKKGLHNLLSEEDYSQMIELIDLQEKNEWTKGYTAGRGSLDNEIKVIKEQSKTESLEKAN